MTEDEKEDPGYCGLGIETGKNDPYWEGACAPHDKQYNKLKAGEAKQSNWVTQRKFAVNTTKILLKSIYAVATYPLYLVLGTLGGAIRYQQIKNRIKRFKS